MYIYDTQKSVIFTDNGQRAFLAVRDFCESMLKQAGAVQAGKAMSAASALCDSWEMMACVDRLVELGELREVTVGEKCAWQHRVFVSGKHSG